MPTFSINPSAILIDMRTGQATRDLFRLLDYLNTVASDLASLIVIDSIADGDTTHAPSRNSVFDALALKSNITDLVSTLLVDSIADADTTHAPTGNSVFDALALKVPTSRTVSAGGIATGGGALSADRTITVTAAVQSDQEAGSSTSVAVVPGVQQFHPSAAKCWLDATVSTGTPSIAASYNITSITDNGVGDLGITIATDFSSANWAHTMQVESTTATAFRVTHAYSKAAGSISGGNATASGAAPFSASDPVAWNFIGFGDQ